uniref:Uncharacterized protein n=1 Tax=Micrurus surinamensis TaxID=129470 RepID=A0A2D4PBG9_MICSU
MVVSQGLLVLSAKAVGKPSWNSKVFPDCLTGLRKRRFNVSHFQWCFCSRGNFEKKKKAEEASWMRSETFSQKNQKVQFCLLKKADLEQPMIWITENLYRQETYLLVDAEQITCGDFLLVHRLQQRFPQVSHE